MKLKLLLLLIQLHWSAKSCKTDIIRSFNLHGLLVPDRLNVLCPRIQYNCCSKHDQMKIHKDWKIYKANLKSHYARQDYYLNRFVRSFVMTKDNLNLKRIIAEFSKENNTPSFELI